jgi:hypothetical protein
VACQADGRPIGEKRLKQIPWAVCCLKHQQELEETSPRRPLSSLCPTVIRSPMAGLTLQQDLDILLDRLADALRQYAASVPYPDKTGGNWPNKIETIKKHIAQAREIIAND